MPRASPTTLARPILPRRPDPWRGRPMRRRCRSRRAAPAGRLRRGCAVEWSTRSPRGRPKATAAREGSPADERLRETQPGPGLDENEADRNERQERRDPERCKETEDRQEQCRRGQKMPVGDFTGQAELRTGRNAPSLPAQARDRPSYRIDLHPILSRAVDDRTAKCGSRMLGKAVELGVMSHEDIKIGHVDVTSRCFERRRGPCG